MWFSEEGFVTGCEQAIDEDGTQAVRTIQAGLSYAWSNFMGPILRV